MKMTGGTFDFPVSKEMYKKNKLQIVAPQIVWISLLGSKTEKGKRKKRNETKQNKTATNVL